jgi:hypothetical protein
MVVCTDKNAVGCEAVPDVLSQGGGREPGPWPRRVVAVVVLVLAGVVLVQHLPRSRVRTPRPARAAATVTAALTVVPGTWLSSDALVSFGWPAGSDSLVTELSFTTKVQLTSWRPGAGRLAIALLRPQQSPASLVIGQYAP